jgi:ABC-2 type transport system permease protein
VFYSVHSLSPFWQSVSHFNPVFYMIDGFRYGFFGQGDVDPWLGLAVVAPCALVLSAMTWMMLRSGYKLRH